MLKHMAALPWSKECGREMIMAVKAKMKVIVLKSSAAASIKKKKKEPQKQDVKIPALSLPSSNIKWVI